ncbi:MAG: M17 family metallopeptidase [Phycisphaerae bacterium]
MKIQFVGAAVRSGDLRVQLAWVPSEPPKGGLPLEAGEIRVRSGGSRAPSVVLGLGQCKNMKDHELLGRGASLGRWLVAHRVRRAVVDMTPVARSGIDGATEAFCAGLVLGSFRFDRYQEKAKSGQVTVILKVPRLTAADRTSIRTAVTIAEATNLAREWGHEPPNMVNPVTLAGRCEELAQDAGLGCTVYDDTQLADMGAHAIVQVGVASPTPSRLIILEHAGSPDKKNARPVVLVGKAVTFDTGGYSLKDKTGIVGMKYDKCGGMAVIATLKAAAQLKLPTPVVGVIAAAENMISGEAYRPNDIVTTMSGKTVEIISTDAEGRMVLADALTYAQKEYKPRCIIDLATLTGGVVVALGGVFGGLFCREAALSERLLASAQRTHERLWRLPLDEDYFELIKGDDSDLKNSGGRSAHATIGAMFLQQFIKKNVPWAHLDIAGVADTDKDSDICPKGATGFGVRLLADFLTRLDQA